LARSRQRKFVRMASLHSQKPSVTGTAGGFSAKLRAISRSTAAPLALSWLLGSVPRIVVSPHDHCGFLVSLRILGQSEPGCFGRLCPSWCLSVDFQPDVMQAGEERQRPQVAPSSPLTLNLRKGNCFSSSSRNAKIGLQLSLPLHAIELNILARSAVLWVRVVAREHLHSDAHVRAACLDWP